MKVEDRQVVLRVLVLSFTKVFRGAYLVDRRIEDVPIHIEEVEYSEVVITHKS